MSMVKSAHVGGGNNAAMSFDATQYADAKTQIAATSNTARWLAIFEIAVKHAEDRELESDGALQGWIEVKVLARRRLLGL